MKKYIVALLLLACSIASAETIAEKLTRIDNEKTAIGLAIVAKGQTVGAFETYSEAVGNIMSATDAWQMPYSGVDFTTATDSAPTDYSNVTSWLASWTEYWPIEYTATIANAVVEAYCGACLTLDGDVVFAPFSATKVAIYRVSSSSLELCSNVHGAGASAYSSCVTAPSGDVIMLPYAATKIGIYHPDTNTFSSSTADISGAGGYAWRGPTVLPSGKILLTPWYANNIYVYDPVSDTVAVGPAITDVNPAFNGATIAGADLVVLTPESATNIGLYKISTNEYANGVAHGQGAIAFYGAGQLIEDGRVVFAPRNAANIGIFTPDGMASGTLATIAHGEGTGVFSGVTMLPDRTLLFTPWACDYFGRLDTTSGKYTRLILSPTNANVMQFYGRGVLATDGQVVFAPYGLTTANTGVSVHTRFNNIQIQNLTNPVINRN